MDEKEAEARPVMGTIFLVYIYVCRYVGLSMGKPYKKSVCKKNEWAELRGPNMHMLSKSVLSG